jgi:uncharacterized protein
MRFTWDQAKNRRNYIKHQVSFEMATLAFDDPSAISVPDPLEEERWVTIGSAQSVVLLAVAHAWGELGGEEEIRIISARKATPRERTYYEEGW